MKTIVTVQEISELDIKPPEAIAEWRKLTHSAIKARWPNQSEWVKANWPNENENSIHAAFEHYNFSYIENSDCGSIYANKRPSESELWWWYRESKPALFWREKLLPASEQTRSSKITNPRADWVSDGMAEYVPNAKRLIDLSTNGSKLLNLVVKDHPGLLSVKTAGVTADLENETAINVQIQPTPVSKLKNLEPADTVIAIDLLDRTADMSVLLDSFLHLVSPGGVLFLTTAVASGFEIQTLWSDSPSIIPPDKLNLPSIVALQKFFADPHWEILELSTPGMFDVDTVRKVIQEKKDKPWPRIVKSMVEKTSQSDRLALVKLLQSLRMTSFARLVVRRKR